MIYWAGVIAVFLSSGKLDMSGAGADFDEAQTAIRHLTLKRRGRAVKDMHIKAAVHAHALLKAHWSSVVAIAELLRRTGKIDRTTIRAALSLTHNGE